MKSKWMVGHQCTVGLNFVRVYQIRDTSEPDHSGNRIWIDKIFDTDEEAQAEADRLNALEEGKSKEMTWKRARRTESKDGVIITYELKEDPNWTIQSIKTHIEHANGVGTWDHTVFQVFRKGKFKVEKSTLKDAKEYARKQIDKG